MKYTIPHLLLHSFEKHATKPSLTFAGEQAYTYSELSELTAKTVSFLQHQGISKGDKVALWGSNSPQWGMIYLATTVMGAVIVPILPETLPSDTGVLVRHSGSKMLFCSEIQHSKIQENQIPSACSIFRIEDIESLVSTFKPHFSDPDQVGEDDLAAIIYTSGTTGKAKGVMLSHRNIAHVSWHGGDIQPLVPEDRFLSVLPMAHTYENSLGFLFPLFNGASVHYLRKAPTASVLLPLLLQVRPTMMLTVPLIMEKMYRQKIRPQLTKGLLLKTLYSIAPFRKLLHRAAGKKLMKTFGGCLKFFGIGGAKLNPLVERFLREARFPYAIGYGLTESAPLLAGANAHFTRFESTGPALTGVTLKINDPDPKTGEGEIWAKGPNIMMGYFREPALTAEVITPEGWLRTGDLGRLSKTGYLYIRGRLKNIIITATGKNIYPEDIEALINNQPYVTESLVIERKGRLVALVQLNMEELEQSFQQFLDNLETKKAEILEEIRQVVNAHMNKISQLQACEIQPQPFEKTATMKIKRFLYQ